MLQNILNTVGLVLEVFGALLLYSEFLEWYRATSKNIERLQQRTEENLGRTLDPALVGKAAQEEGGCYVTFCGILLLFTTLMLVPLIVGLRTGSPDDKKPTMVALFILILLSWLYAGTVVLPWAVLRLVRLPFMMRLGDKLALRMGMALALAGLVVQIVATWIPP